MQPPLQLCRNGAPVPGFLGVCSQAEAEQLGQALETVLGPAELAHFRQLQFPLRRGSYLLGRIALKRALGALLPEPRLERLEILSGVFGQPLVRAAAPAAAEISLAHSHGVALGAACAAGHPVGIDLELIEPARVDVFTRVFTPEEFTLLAGAGVPQPPAGFVLWTVKEALSKVLRCGLTVPFEVLRAKSIVPGSAGPAGTQWLVEFENFWQYKAHAWIVGAYALAVVIPRKTDLGFSPDSALTALLETRPAPRPAV